MLYGECMESPVVNATSVDPDQMPRSTASDLGLQLFANYPFDGLQTEMNWHIVYSTVGGSVVGHRLCLAKSLKLNYK